MSSIYHKYILIKRKEAEIIEIPIQDDSKAKENKNYNNTTFYISLEKQQSWSSFTIYFEIAALLINCK